MSLLPVNAVLQHPSVQPKESGLNDQEIQVLCQPRTLNVRRLPEDSRPKLRACSTVSLPAKIDFRDKFTHAIFDQGSVGSCVANSTVAAFEFLDPSFQGSRLFAYWISRDIEGLTGEDSGTVPSDEIQALVKMGLAPERDFVYDTSKVFSKPPEIAYQDALQHKIVVHCKVASDVNSIKTALAVGIPIVNCLSIYSSFQTVQTFKTGVIPLPTGNDQLLGGHSTLFCGFDDTKSWFICRNSWGASWGDKGYFYLPYAYITNDRCWDCCQIRQVQMSQNKPDQVNTTINTKDSWISTPAFKYQTTWTNDNVYFSFQPFQPCEWVDIHIKEYPNTSLNVRMTYRDRIHSFVSFNVKKEHIDQLSYNFTFFTDHHATDTSVFRGITSQ